jgi:hypothetical protein
MRQRMIGFSCRPQRAETGRKGIGGCGRTCGRERVPQIADHGIGYGALLNLRTRIRRHLRGGKTAPTLGDQDGNLEDGNEIAPD